MKTLSDIYFEGYNKWAKLKYGKDYKKLESYGLIEEANNQACIYLVDWLLSHKDITIISPDYLYQTKYTIKQEYSETYTPKKIAKANAKSKLKNGKQTKSVLKAKKRVLK